MKVEKLNLSFKNYNDDQLQTRAESILQMMTGNALFPNPIPPLTDLQAAITAYRSALTEATTRDSVKIALRKQERANLEAVLRKLAMYVMFVADGDAYILASSGYELSKQPERIALGEPGAVTLSYDVTGSLQARLPRVQGARTYVFGITPAPATAESQWDETILVRSSYKFEDLTPGTLYAIRVGAIGTEQEVAYTNITTKIAV